MLPHFIVLAGYFRWCQRPNDKPNTFPHCQTCLKEGLVWSRCVLCCHHHRNGEQALQPGAGRWPWEVGFDFTLFLCVGCGAWPTMLWSPAVTWRKQFAVWPSAPMDLSWPWAWRMALSLFSESGTYRPYRKWCQKCPLVETSSPGHHVFQDFRKNAFTLSNRNTLDSQSPICISQIQTLWKSTVLG